MNKLLTIFVISAIWFTGCASTRYVRIELHGKGSYHPLTGVRVEQGDITIWKAVSNNEQMQAPDNFFDPAENSQWEP